MDGWMQNTCKFPTVKKQKNKQTNKQTNKQKTCNDKYVYMCMGYKIGKEKGHDKM